MRYVMSMIGALVLASSSAAMAAPDEAGETVTPAAKAAAVEEAVTRAAVENELETRYKKEFQGLSLGVGLSLTLDMGSHDRVNGAELVNGLVRVSEEENARARIMLESHYFFTPDGPLLNVDQGDWGVGPFVAIQPGEGEIIEAAALGLMIGFRRKNEPGSWNIGVGVVYDPKTKTLGDGLEPNAPLPAGETEIRYKQRSQNGIVILTSFTF